WPSALRSSASTSTTATALLARPKARSRSPIPDDTSVAPGGRVMTIVHELDLPEVDFLGLDRDAALAALDAARGQHWLGRTALGYAVPGYDDVTPILRDRRFHSALSLLPQMSNVPEGHMRQRQERSILAMEGDEHTRVRRLASPAFTPRATDRLRPFMRDVVNDL